LEETIMIRKKNAERKCAGIEWDYDGATEAHLLQQVHAYLEGRHGVLSDDQRLEVCREFWNWQANIGRGMGGPRRGTWLPAARIAVADLGQEFVDTFAPLIACTPVFSRFGDCIELAPGWPAGDFPQPSEVQL